MLPRCPHCRAPHLLDPDALRAAMEKYRKDYRSWRRGATKGSKGEVAKVTEPVESPKKQRESEEARGAPAAVYKEDPVVVVERGPLEAVPLRRLLLEAVARFSAANGVRVDCPPGTGPHKGASMALHVGCTWRDRLCRTRHAFTVRDLEER